MSRVRLADHSGRRHFTVTRTPARLIDPPAAWSDEERTVLAWVRRRLGGTAHERRVARIASRMFDLTAARHGLSARHRRLLRLAAIVHDVGRCVNDDDHPQEGAYLLLADHALPLSAQDRRLLAFLTRYHRGAVPEPGFERILRRDDPREPAYKLLGLLRAADALDKRPQRREPPRLRLTLDGPRLRVDCLVRKRPRRTEKTLTQPAKFRLLEELTGCRVHVRVRRDLAAAA